MKKDTFLKVASKAILTWVLLSQISGGASLKAQNFVVSETNGFEWRLMGRVFFDAGAFFNDKTDIAMGYRSMICV